MPIFVVLATLEDAEDLEKKVDLTFSEEDRRALSVGTWFVRSKRTTSGQVVKDLGIDLEKGPHGLVVAAANTKVTTY